MIEAFYHAWTHKDTTQLDILLHPQLFGIRRYNESLYFDKESTIEACLLDEPFVIESLVESPIQHGYIEYQLQINGQDIVGKARIVDGCIDKLYEEIKRDITRIKCVCSYDGSHYFGYQKQPNVVSIQETIEHAIMNALQLHEIPTIYSSGRTDKGVHALHQVFHTDIKSSIPVSKMKQIINSYLPDDIHIRELEEVPQTFHSRYDVSSKEYMYRINTSGYNPIQRNYEWAVDKIDIQRLKQELASIIGTHDFQSFTKQTGDSTVRTIFDVDVKEEDNHIIIHIQGNGFMRYMVRYIIGAAVSISTGALSISMSELLQKKDVTILKDMAPASGLYLYNVTYER